MTDNGLGKDMWTLPLWKIENVLFVSGPMHGFALTRGAGTDRIPVLLPRRIVLFCSTVHEQSIDSGLPSASIPAQRTEQGHLGHHWPLLGIRCIILLSNALAMLTYQPRMAAA